MVLCPPAKSELSPEGDMSSLVESRCCLASVAPPASQSSSRSSRRPSYKFWQRDGVKFLFLRFSSRESGEKNSARPTCALTGPVVPCSCALDAINYLPLSVVHCSSRRYRPRRFGCVRSLTDEKRERKKPPIERQCRI